MRNVIRLGRSAAATALAGTLIAFAVAVPEALPASAAPAVASGTVSCNIAGIGKFVPQLTAVGSVTHLKIKFNGKSAGCTSAAGAGGAVINIASAKFHGVGKLVDNAGGYWNGCNDFTNSDVIGSVIVKIIWNATPAIASTTITYTSGTSPLVSNNAGVDDLNFPSGATTTITGSFASSLNAQMVQNTAIVNACSSSWGPYQPYTFAPTSTLNIF